MPEPAKLNPVAKSGRGPSRPYPSISVSAATQVADAIREHNAGRPMNRLLLAEALGLSPSSTQLRDLISASGKYGFTKGHYHSDTIALDKRGEALGQRAPDARLSAMREGFRSVSVFERALNYYNNNRLPSKDLLAKAATQPGLGVPSEWSVEFAEILAVSGRELGYVRDIAGSPHVLVNAGPPAPINEEAIVSESEQSSMLLNGHASPVDVPLDIPIGTGDSSALGRSGGTESNSKPLQFFVAHGSNHVPLDQLTRILQQFKIPFVVAQEEANAGRPISTKIKELMDSCTAGIFIFTADEQFTDSSGRPIWRPRENVIFELGAASYLYGRRIVIFKEKDVDFPSDFKDLGWIGFERDRLDAKSIDLMKELIALGALKLVAGD